MTQTTQHIGPYRVESLLSLHDGIEVWQAHGAKGHVALKCATDPAKVEAIEQEAARLRKAAHPHIVPLLDYADHWLATAFFQGQPIDRWALGRPLHELVSLLLEVAGTLRDLHAKDLVHGDISPSNVRVDEAGHTKIIDLAPPTSRGTAGFIAPEKLAHTPDDPAAADRYSFGALIFAMLTSRAPFEGIDNASIAYKPKTAVALPASTWRADIPARLDRLISRLLSREPDRRPKWREILHVLMHAHDDKPAAPVLGMVRARQQLGEAIARATGGACVLVILYGPIGSGRRTLAREGVRLASLEGMTYLRSASADEIEQAAAEGHKPVSVLRLGTPGSFATARRLLSVPSGCLTIAWCAKPVPPLASLGAIHIAPDLLTCEDAQEIAATLGLSATRARHAWHATHGLPGALWLSLSRDVASLSATSTLRLPHETTRIIDLLRQSGGKAHLDTLLSSLDLSHTVLSEYLDLLIASGHVITEDGWSYRLHRTPPQEA